MHHHCSKGKGKRLPSPTNSSDEEGGMIRNQTTPSKRPCKSSTEHVQAAAVEKIGSIATSSSSKGMAGFSALIANRTSLSAAKVETTQGIKGGASGRLGRTSTKPKAMGKTDAESMTVGAIVFLVVGAMMEDPSNTSLFNPFYSLESDVNTSPIALTGMKQAGLCVMLDTGYKFFSTDTYGMIDHKLQGLFPKLYDWLAEDDVLGSASSWLICIKPPYSKSIIVYTGDSELPTGFDIITACTMSGRTKNSIPHYVLYLATRNPVPSELVQSWRPKASSNQTASSSSHFQILDDGSLQEESDDEVDTSSDPPPLPSILPLLQQPCRGLCYQRNEESEVETEITEIIELSSDDDPTPDTVAKEDPAMDPATPPYIAEFNDTFSSSMHFGGDDNPWN